MVDQGKWAIRRGRLKRWFGNRRRGAADRLTNPKTIAVCFVAGPVAIFIFWYFIQTPVPSEGLGEMTVRFSKDTGLIMTGWAALVAAINYFVPTLHQRWAVNLRLRESQKERIRVLDNFRLSKQTGRVVEFCDKRSIYNAIINMLKRLDSESGDQMPKTPRYNVCMLLCSPALDYWGNEESRVPETNQIAWGFEFLSIIDKLAKRHDIRFDICHLPVQPSSGVNVLSNFISALAAYIIQTEYQFKTDDPAKSDAEFKKLSEALRERSKLVAEEFAGWAGHPDKGSRFHIYTHMINIPFQIVLVASKDVTEVVVAFASRDVLEREQKREVKGFYSSDPDVVQIFHEVFQTYVESQERIPYIPPHTSNISEEHTEARSHRIPSYYYDLVGPLHVLSGTFSPVIGNSTKFTVWLLDKLLTTGDYEHKKYCWGSKVRRVLDVGSGTGVLALAVDAILQKRCGRAGDYMITAIDSCPKAQKILELNIPPEAKPRILVNPWALFSDTNGKGEIADAGFKNGKGQKILINGDFAGFDLIVADLPFVHAKKRTEEDLRFLDHKHQLHQALFHVVNRSDLLSPDGLLVTAFSSLGGFEDIAELEGYMHTHNIQIIQRVDFNESGYMWMVYVLMKKFDYDRQKEKLWWEVLDAKNRESWEPESGKKQEKERP